MSQYEKTVYGLVINPRNGELFQAVRSETGNVSILDFDDKSKGSGYFHRSSMDEKYALSEAITDLPRVHTEYGVAHPGSGLGTVLYTALCYAAHLDQAAHGQSFATNIKGNGISSIKGTRSESADTWWENARAKYGLAIRVEGCKQDDFNTEGRFRESDIESEVVHEIEARHGWSGIELEEYDARYEATGTRETCATADAYPFSNAAKKHLIASWYNANDDNEAFIYLNLERFEEIDKNVILAANMASYKGSEYADKIFWQLAAIAHRAGATTREVEAMHTRYLDAIDVRLGPDLEHPALVAKTFELTTPATGRVVRQPVGRKVMPVRYGRGRTREERPRHLRWWPTRASGRPADQLSTGAHEALLDLARRRRALGWDVFAGGDD